MDKIKRKPLPATSLPEDLKTDTEDDFKRISTEIQQTPPVHAKRNIKLFGWELHRPLPPPYSETPCHASAKPTLIQRFDRIFPPYKRYLGTRRRKFLILLAVVLVLLLALIIGLAVGLSSGFSKTQNLPLPTNRETHTGDLTYYSQGMGACGIVNSESDKIVAISHLVFDAAQVGSNPNSNPLCRKKIRTTTPQLSFQQCPSRKAGEVTRGEDREAYTLRQVIKTDKAPTSKRDGRNLSMSDFNNVLSTVVNFGDGFIQSTFTPPQFRLLGILADNQNHTDTTIDLETLNLHNRNEHDASMSRLDRIQGDTIQVQPDLVEKILCDTVPEDYSYLNTSSIGRTRVRRENESRATSGEPSENMTITPGVVEGALALLFIGEGLGEDADNMFMKKETLREWMVFERIPKGFRRSERVIVTDDLARIIDKVDYWRRHWLET
ncbi:hypothetical protein BLS_009742 [Venturia inaequalis]|uniref:Heme haloperoxidase family profile domain-containing protein n=1 Tax=Venturia inaequalis TaxID=5025 RepID=A0A8H3YMH8_VENIN|nr:hypothetical protein BLS_009742 [Venturia inaequalis]